MTSVLFIVNPIAGKGIGKVNLTAAFSKCRFDWSAVYTEYPGHAHELARKSSADIIVAVGGDGTVNEVASALVGTGKILGIVPRGSGNGLALHLGYSLIPGRAVESINAASIQTIDTATFNGRPFFCTGGVGYDAFVSEKFSQVGKRGFKTYVEEALKSWKNYKAETYTIEMDDCTIRSRAMFVTVANSNQWGNNGRIAPNASLQDGLLDVVVVDEIGFDILNIISAPALVALLFARQIDKVSKYHLYRSKLVKISVPEEGPAHVDGEPVSHPGTELTYSVRPSSLKVIVP